MPNKRRCDRSRILLVSKNSRVFENSRKKGITNHSTRWTRSFSPDITDNALTFICFQAAIFSEPKKGERERETDRKIGGGEKNKTKIREMDNKNPAIWRERCTRARMLLISPLPIPFCRNLRYGRGHRA